MQPEGKLHAWLTAIGIVIPCLTGGLLVAFHAPLRNEVKADWFEGDKVAIQSIYHFASDDCRCSERLLGHLAGRAPRPSAKEVVVYIGKRKPIHELLQSRGYEVRMEDSPAASGVEAAPWLLVRDAAGGISYSGGYEPAPYWEARILFNVEHRTLKASLPTTGCVTSKALRAGTLAYQLKDLLPRL
jgi:hypothetical protein